MITKNSSGTSLSANYDTKVATSPREWEVQFYMNGNLLSCGIKSVTVTKGSCGDTEAFSIGNVYSSMMNAELMGLTDDIKGRDIEVRVGLNTGSMEWITIGWFTAIDVVKTAYTASVTAYGFSTTKTAGSIAVPGTLTLANIASAIQTASGCTVTFDTGITTSYEIAGTLDGDVSCYDALALLAHVCGGYAVDTYDGNFAIHKFSDTSTLSLTTDRMKNLPSVEELPFQITGVQVTATGQYTYSLTTDVAIDPSKTYYTRSGTAPNYVYTEVEEPDVADIGTYYERFDVVYTYGSPIVMYDSDEYITQDIFNNIYKGIVGYSFYTGTIDLSVGDPRIEGNDVLTVTDVNGDVYTIPCHTVTHTYDGGLLTAIKAVKATNGGSGLVTKAPITQQMDLISTATALAQASAESAVNYAEQAQQSAQQSAETLALMEQYAEDAGTTLTGIYQDAEDAKANALSAEESAYDATVSASVALNQLGIVEDVVGVLDLLTKNGTYELTQDTEVVPDKWYFTRSGYQGGTATGAIATFNTTAGDNITSLTADIEPIQTLNGYDSVWVGGAGKNKLQNTASSTSSSGVTFTVNSDGTVNTANTATASTGLTLNSNFTLSAGSYVLSGCPANGSGSTYALTIVIGGTAYYDYGSGYSFTLSQDTTIDRVRIVVYNGGNVSGKVWKPMIRKSTESADFEPYENLCPVSGWDEVNVARTGKNLYSTTPDVDAFNNNGGATHSGSGGVLTINATATNNSGCYGSNISELFAITQFLKGRVFTYSFDLKSSVSASLFVGFENCGAKLVNATTSWQRITITSTSGGGHAFLLYNRSGSACTIEARNIQIELGSTATTYEAYQGNTYTTALGTTVYGGTLDVTTGVLTVDRAYATVNDFTWTYNSTYQLFWTSVSGMLRPCDLICSHYEQSVVGSLGDIPNNSIWNKSYGFASTNLVIKDTRFTDANTFKTNMSGVGFVYELATPLTYNLTAQQISTLLGENNVWASTGDVTVTYRDTYVYTVVQNPSGDPNAQGWYELTGIDQAIQNYVSSHLVIDNQGLWLKQDGTNAMLQISTDGVTLYAPNGHKIGQYGATAIVGDPDYMHITMTGTRLSFYDGQQEVAYIDDQQLYITQTVVLQQMDLGIPAPNGLGQWSWKVHANSETPPRNNLNLKWIG